MTGFKVLAGLAICITTLAVGWARFEETRPIKMPQPMPVPSEASQLETPAQSTAGLKYELRVARGVVTIVNRDAYRWTHVVANVGEGFETFWCPAPGGVEPNIEMRLVLDQCVSTSGKKPDAAWVVRVVAQEGSLICGMEPGVPAR